MSVKIYTRKLCSYCVHAKNLFDRLGVAYEEISVDGDQEALLRMVEMSGRRSVPQIWIGDTHVGGCDDLYALHRNGQLQGLLDADANAGRA
ncbi:glutaredoxin 3 [Saccharophagus sp. K07]|jgi:glutaredoxin 3|uniref:glutaredoxin 3 n=1 Tax=Saccharophagus sp. K07 TaxID=2283636 RepID=UPI001652182A|nr:glutaredoxin 3 [Saccharophagus sp. K07]MBC6905877.1 glutaredoxin 3 [Saccharophagus sp. K07]